MSFDFRQRLDDEFQRLGERLKKPIDLLNRKLSPDDLVDTAVIGGVSVADILAGKVAEWQIPDDVKEAFHSQYPGISRSFVDEVHDLSSHPEQLAGLINGVKGKLFEIDYVEWLNHGHLPSGFTAELAHNANNPAWDVLIRDSHGHADEVLQLKATASIAYVKHALELHPDVDVVVPHDLYDKLADHHEVLSHIVFAPQDLSHLTNHVHEAVTNADAAGIHFHVPAVAFLFAAYQSSTRYRNGDISLRDALQQFGERSLLALIASGAGWAASAVAHTTFVAIPIAMSARLVGSQLFHNRDRRIVLDAKIVITRNSRAALESRTFSLEN